MHSPDPREPVIVVRSTPRRVRRYFHGGVPGLTLGDWLLPPVMTHTDKTTARFLRPEDDEPWLRSRDRVYVTPQLALAWVFAGTYPNGAMYEVEPLWPLTLDPDSSVRGLSWRCPRARVVAVVHPVVRLEEVLALNPIESLAPIVAAKAAHAVAGGLA